MLPRNKERRNAWSLLSFALTLLIAATVTLGQAGIRNQVERQLRGQEEPNGPAGPGRTPGPNQPGEIADEDFKQIRDAKTPEQLVELAKTFVATQKLPAAQKAIEVAAIKKPALLEDTQKQTPKEWNDLWFTHRAAIREKKLKPTDAAGRVKIAAWLYDAGLMTQARDLLTIAIAMDKNLPEAKALADKWNISSAGPVQFDLTLGLNTPLLADTLPDENLVVSPHGKDRKFFIIPISYNPAGLRLLISKGDIKVVSDDGKPCTIAGLALLERTNTGNSSPDHPLEDRGKTPDIKMNGAGEPIWEALQIDATKDGKPQEVTAKNMAHPFARPKPGTPPAPPPQNAGLQVVKKPISGSAAYIVEVPAGFTSVQVTYKTEPPITYTADFLGVLAKATDKLTLADRQHLLQVLAPEAASKFPSIAIAALRKLNIIRLGGNQGSSSNDPSQKAPPDILAIEKAFITALGHEDAGVRRIAFDMLMTNPPNEVAALIAAEKNEKTLLHMAAEIRTYVNDVQASIDAANALNANQPAPQTTDEPQLPTLPGSTGIITVISGVLQSGSAAAREQTIDAILKNPFQSTVESLRAANDDAVGQLLKKLPAIENAPLKGVILRVLLKRSDKKMLRDIFEAYRGTPLIISRDDDAILELAVTNNTPEVRRSILGLLVNTDLSRLSNSDKLKKMIEALSANEMTRDPATRKAMLDLALEKTKGAYQAPIKRTNQPQSQNGPGATGFDDLLAVVAAAPNADTANAVAAATGLISVGHVQALQERLQKMAPPEKLDERVQTLIQNLSRDKDLATREALPIFLGMQLSNSNPKTLAQALSALTKVQKQTDPKQRWRFNQAAKQTIDSKQLATLSLNGDEKVSSPALALLKDLVGMTQKESAEFEGLPEEGGRQAWLTTFDQGRLEKATGPFQCIIYLDVKPARTNEPGKLNEKERNSIPLISSEIRFQRSTKGGAILIMAGDEQIGPPDTKDAPSAPNSVRINAAPLLRTALGSPDAAKEGIAGKINPLSLRAEQVCELKYEQLGMWTGEVTFQEENGVTLAPEFTLQPAAAKIVFEPVTK